MDPASIVIAIVPVLKTVFNVSKRVSTFVSDVKEVNNAIDGLSAELTSVESSLEAVKAGLTSFISSETEDGPQTSFKDPAFQAVSGSLDGCKGTLDRFNQAVDGLGEPNNSLGNRLVRQVRLDWSQNHMLVCRSQLQTHISALNLALHMVNLLATFSAPEIVIAELGPRIDEVLIKVEQLSSTVLIRAPPAPSSSSGTVEDTTNSNLADAAIKSNEQIDFLKISARTLVRRARTVVLRSEAGTTCGEEEASTLPPVQRWLSDAQPSATRPIPTLDMPSDPSGRRDMMPSSARRDDTEDEDDDLRRKQGLEVDIAGRLLVTGLDEFKRENFESAARFLSKGIVKSKNLPLDLKAQMRIQSDIHSSELTLAACSMHCDDLDEAQSRLLAFLEHETDTKHIRQILQAQHLLADVYFRRGEFAEAHRYCLEAVSGRRDYRRNGVPLELYHESATLMSNICTALGDEEEATVYAQLTPSSAKSSTHHSSSAVHVNTLGSRETQVSSAIQSSTTLSQPPMSVSGTSGGMCTQTPRVTSDIASTEPSTPLASPSVTERPLADQTRSPLTSAPTSPSTQSRRFSFPNFAAKRRPSSQGSSKNISQSSSLCKGAKNVQSHGLGSCFGTVTEKLAFEATDKRYRTCKKCKFRGKPWDPHTVRQAGNPLSTHESTGIHYRWSFLAASHVSCKATHLPPQYCCLVCLAQGLAEGAPLSDDDLMKHLLDAHRANLSKDVQEATRCFVGPLEDGVVWDVHIPTPADLM